jgi:hypothetical protein
MHCRRFQELFSDLHDGLLGGGEKDRLIAHLEECTECSSQWKRFEESLSSLALLTEDGAPEGFSEAVFRRIAEGKRERKVPPLRQLLFSPAGGIVCLMLFLVGAGVGFLAGRQGSTPPLQEVKAMAERDGVFLLPGRTASGIEYALVPVGGREPRVRVPHPTPLPVQMPLSRSREFLVGGSETMEVYLQPDRVLASAGSPPQNGRGAHSLERAYQALVEDSY